MLYSRLLLVICRSVCAVVSCSVASNSLQPYGLQPTRLLCPWGFSRQEYWGGLPWTHALLQGIFPTQGSNPGLPHCKRFIYHLSLQGSPRILEWVAYPFSRRTTQPRNQTRVSCIAGRFFTSWATREAPESPYDPAIPYLDNHSSERHSPHSSLQHCLQ